MKRNDLILAVDRVFNPQNDDCIEDGTPPVEELPNDRLTKEYGFSFPFLCTDDGWEHQSFHPFNRTCSPENDGPHALMRNILVPFQLFLSALKLYADSIIAYNGCSVRHGELRYYPSIVLTFWAAFESFVRYKSELMLITAKDIPSEVNNFLREIQPTVDSNCSIKKRVQYHSVLDRYRVMIRYGYGYKMDKGNKFWQQLEKAKQLRDYYTHVDMRISREISSTDVLSFMESVLLGIIWPSYETKRTLLMRVYFLYNIWAGLKDLTDSYSEVPMANDLCFRQQYLFHCDFENVDDDRFPTFSEFMRTLT